MRQQGPKSKITGFLFPLSGRVSALSETSRYLHQLHKRMSPNLRCRSNPFLGHQHANNPQGKPRQNFAAEHGNQAGDRNGQGRGGGQHRTYTKPTSRTAETRRHCGPQVIKTTESSDGPCNNENKNSQHNKVRIRYFQGSIQPDEQAAQNGPSGKLDESVTHSSEICPQIKECSPADKG